MYLSDLFICSKAITCLYLKLIAVLVKKYLICAYPVLEPGANSRCE